MGGWLRWTRDVVGGFAAGFFAYVVVGGLISLAVTLAVAKSGSVCPTDMYGALGVRCESSLARTLWYAVADLPGIMLFIPYSATFLIASPISDANTYYVIDPVRQWISAGLFITLVAVGFFGWRTRSPAVAWALLLLLVGEVALMVARAWIPGS